MNATCWRCSGCEALCINQQDIEKRNAQVRLMGEIYARANYILSWLSLDQGMLTHKNTLLSRISQKATHHRLHGRKDIQDLLQKFFKPPHWTRTQIIQEILLGRSVMIATPTSSNGVDDMPLSFLSGFYQNVRETKI